MKTDAKCFYDDNGYHVARSVFTGDEVREIRDHFMELRKQGPKPGDFGGDPKRGASDPLNKFPRFINMHDWDAKTRAWIADPRFVNTARELIGDDLVLWQTMLYFKPPGARGQAFHQDNQFVRKHPTIAAWLALDDCDEANGQMVVVPGSHKLGILPVQQADMTSSFSFAATAMPADAKLVGVDMRAGDALFFGGFTIHGSYPNQTKDRFRRTFIVHWFAAHTQELPDDPKTRVQSLKAAY